MNAAPCLALLGLEKTKIFVANPTDFSYQCGQMHHDGARGKPVLPQKMHK